MKTTKVRIKNSQIRRHSNLKRTGTLSNTADVYDRQCCHLAGKTIQVKWNTWRWRHRIRSKGCRRSWETAGLWRPSCCHRTRARYLQTARSLCEPTRVHPRQVHTLQVYTWASHRCIFSTGKHLHGIFMTGIQGQTSLRPRQKQNHYEANVRPRPSPRQDHFKTKSKARPLWGQGKDKTTLRPMSDQGQVQGKTTLKPSPRQDHFKAKAKTKPL